MHKIFTLFGILLLLLGSSACAFKSGLYSIIITAPGVQHESNPFNDLPEPYHKKLAYFPTSIQDLDASLLQTVEDSLNKYTFHEVDTTLKISNGNITVSLNNCNKQGLSLLILDEYQPVKRGKFIRLKFRYACVQNDAPLTWAATNFYLIDASNECFDGLHTIEFQMYYQNGLPAQKEAALARVLVVGADQ